MKVYCRFYLGAWAIGFAKVQCDDMFVIYLGPVAIVFDWFKEEV